MKEALRRLFLNRRDALTPECIAAKSRSIEERLFVELDYKRSTTILFYVSFRSEVVTLSSIEQALSEGKRVLVPVSHPKERRLTLSHIKDLSELTNGTYGILEPARDFLRPVFHQEVELVLVPGAVFDYLGYRIGYGGGYYDNLLTQLHPQAVALALAFELQLVERLPREAHDRPVHKIITEQRTVIIPEEGV